MRESSLDVAQRLSGITLASDGDMDEWTRNQVLAYMIGQANEHLDDCGEINLTALAEDADAHFNYAGWCGDEQSDVWDLAVMAGALLVHQEPAA